MPRRERRYDAASITRIVPEPSQQGIQTQRRQKLWVDDSYWRQTSWERRVRHLVHRLYDWKTEHQFLGRYNVDKLIHLDTYCRSTSLSRALAVMVLWPLPTILTVVALHAIPMVDPTLGALANFRLFVRSALDHSIIGIMVILTLKQSTRMDSDVYPIRTVVLVAALTAISNEIIWGGVAFLWRFPVPFRELLGTPTWMFFMALYHVIFLRSAIRARWPKLRLSLFIAGTQMTILFSFLALSIAFARTASPTLQLTFVGVAAIFKIVLKRKLWEFARRLDDLSTDVTICLVELAGSLFQTVCLQNSKSVSITALVALADIGQAVLEIWMYLGHEFIVDGRQTLETARKIVESALYPAEPDEFDGSASLFVKSCYAGSTFRKSRSESSVGCAVHTQRQASLVGRRSLLKPPSIPVSLFLPPRLVVRKNASTMLNFRHPSSSFVDHGIVVERHRLHGESQDAAHKPERLGRRVVTIDGITIPRRDQARVLEQSLQLLFSSEVLLFAEWVEVMLPLLYGTFATYIGTCAP